MPAKTSRKATLADYLRPMLGPRTEKPVTSYLADAAEGLFGVPEPPPREGGLMGKLNWAASIPGMLPVGMTAYHGTPHKFAPTPKNPLGEFDLSKIGTGEGAQAYGHGIYLSEAPEVAKTYTWGNMPPGRASEIMHKGEVVPRGTDKFHLLEKIAERGRREAIETLEGDAAFYRKDNYAPDRANWIDSLIKWAKTINPDDIRMRKGGSMYKVDLPDEHVAKMLDWDAPLSQQPEAVKQMVPALARAMGVSDPARLFNTLRGEGFHGSLVGHYGREGAADALRRAGVPGIKYLDQGSRGAGAGTRNFVMFDTSPLNILGVE